MSFWEGIVPDDGGKPFCSINPNPIFISRLWLSRTNFEISFSPPRNMLKEVGIQPGFHILDYGCGPGNYLIPLAELVGKSGKIYALDVHPLAIQRVQNIASRKRLKNVETILSDCRTGLPDKSMDVVLLYDTFHDLSDPDGVSMELHRVLKANGILSFSDHHMKKNEIASRVTERII
jgi:ubiquinone/menaquinone biosynthesis C-methylase UbiE